MRRLCNSSSVRYLALYRPRVGRHGPLFLVHRGCLSFGDLLMDPLTIIGTTGAIANIVDVICKTVKSLRDVHSIWKDADLTIINLIAQLSSLKAALNKISE